MKTLDVKIAYTFVTPFCRRYEYMEDFLSVDSVKALDAVIRDAFNRRHDITGVSVVALVPGNWRGVVIEPYVLDADVYEVTTFRGTEYISKRKAAKYVWDYVESKAA